MSSLFRNFEKEDGEKYYIDALKHYNNDEYIQAFKLCNKSIEFNSKKGHGLLAKLYQQGLGCDINNKLAQHHFSISILETNEDKLMAEINKLILKNKQLITDNNTLQEKCNELKKEQKNLIQEINKLKINNKNQQVSIQYKNNKLLEVNEQLFNSIKRQRYED